MRSESAPRAGPSGRRLEALPPRNPEPLEPNRRAGEGSPRPRKEGILMILYFSKVPRTYLKTLTIIIMTLLTHMIQKVSMTWLTIHLMMIRPCLAWMVWPTWLVAAWEQAVRLLAKPVGRKLYVTIISLRLNCRDFGLSFSLSKKERWWPAQGWGIRHWAAISFWWRNILSSCNDGIGKRPSNRKSHDSVFYKF